MGIARKLVNDRAHRLELGIPATVRRFADPIDAIVINISATGFKAKVDRSLNIGDHVELGVGGKRLGGASVVRVEPGQVGFTFDHVLSSPILQEVREGSIVVFGKFDSNLPPALVSEHASAPYVPGGGVALGLVGIGILTLAAGLFMVAIVTPYLLFRTMLRQLAPLLARH